MSGNNKNGNGKKVYVRPVDVAEFIMLETIIVDLKDEKFSELGEKWGIDP